jgi:molybdopterin converting factor small subunit
VKIRLKLFATLRDYLPAGSSSNEVELDVADGITVQGLIDLEMVPAKRVHLVLVNGYHLPPNAFGATTLGDGDAVAIWPPVAGG